MLLRSMLNTGNAAPIYAQYPLCGSTMQKLLILLRIGNVFLKFLQVHHEEQTTSAGFLDQPEPATESSSPDPDIEIMSTTLAALPNM